MDARKRVANFLRRKLPTNIGRYPEGIRFPIRKEELVFRFERDGVSGPILSQIRKRLAAGA